MTGFADEFYEDHVEAMLDEDFGSQPNWREIADELATALRVHRHRSMCEFRPGWSCEVALRRYEEARNE